MIARATAIDFTVQPAATLPLAVLLDQPCPICDYDEPFGWTMCDGCGRIVCTSCVEEEDAAGTILCRTCCCEDDL